MLMGTEGCRLCDEAEALAVAACRRSGRVLRPLDILDDPELERRYAVRIPVLRRADTGAELDWPFDRAGLYRFLL